MGVKAIAESLGMVTSTCLHIVRVLVEEGLLRVDESTKRYSLGSGLLSLARGAMQANPFPSTVQPVLDRMARRPQAGEPASVLRQHDREVAGPGLRAVDRHQMDLRPASLEPPRSIADARRGRDLREAQQAVEID